MGKQTQIDGVLSPLLQRIRIAKALPFIRGRRILDVGCSNGEILRYLPSDVDYIGVEGNPVYCRKAQDLHPVHKFLNLYLDRHNSGNLSIPERDSILMLAILEHLNEPMEVLRNLRQYLSHEGNIVITTPSDRAETILRMGSRIGIFSTEMDEHKNHFSKEELISICEGAGTSVVHYSQFELGMNHLIVLVK